MKIFIGFDQKNKNIRILKSDKSTGLEAFTLHYQAILFSEEFISEFQMLLTDFVSANNIPRNTSAYLVMPDSTVGFETFDLPYMAKPKMLRALETELSNEYGNNLKDKKLSKFIITSSREFATYGVIYFDRKLVVQLNKVLAESKLFPRAATYDGNAVVNSILHFMPRARGKSFIVADIRGNSTEIAICNKGKTMGVATIQYGIDNVIKCPEVCDEFLASEHTVAEVAVINAREIARAKALTMSSDEEQTGPEMVVEEGAEAAEQTVPAGSIEIKTEEDIAEDELDEEEVEEQLEQAAPGGPKVKIYKKQKRRMPKFMQREIPETPEGIAYENFRIILKWILLYARQAHMTEYLNDPDYAIVNLPEEYHYLIDMANEEQGENGLSIRALKGSEKRSAVLTANMDLYGASFVGSFNQNSNFFRIRLI